MRKGDGGKETDVSVSVCQCGAAATPFPGSTRDYLIPALSYVCDVYDDTGRCRVPRWVLRVRLVIIGSSTGMVWGMVPLQMPKSFCLGVVALAL